MSKREIKFRAWSGSRFFYSDPLEHNQFYMLGGKAYIATEFDGWIVTGWPIEQYTGLKDATTWENATEKQRSDWVSAGNMPSDWNGVEIYEGDVIEGGVVLWFRSAWFVQWEDERIRLPSIPHPIVIGNIHENPELLEVAR